MNKIDQIVIECINNFLFENSQRWQYSSIIDNIVNDAAFFIQKNKHLNKNYQIDNFDIHISYPHSEFNAFTTNNGKIEIQIEEPFDIYDLKTTLYHELEHAIDKNTLQFNKKYTNGTLGVNFQGSEIADDIDYYDSVKTDEIYQKEWLGYDKIETDSTIENYVSILLYILWNKEERKAHLADFIQDKNILTKLEKIINIINNYSLPKLKNRDKQLEKFWLIVGRNVFNNKKGEYRGNKPTIKNHSTYFYFSYFMKKSIFLLNKIKTHYERSILKSPLKPTWL